MMFGCGDRANYAEALFCYLAEWATIIDQFSGCALNRVTAKHLIVGKTSREFWDLKTIHLKVAKLRNAALVDVSQSPHRGVILFHAPWWKLTIWERNK